MTVRPPSTLSLLIAKAAKVATSKVRKPVETATIRELASCSQKWIRK